jgi:hypothetical protein
VENGVGCNDDDEAVRVSNIGGEASSGCCSSSDSGACMPTGQVLSRTQEACIILTFWDE